MLESLSYERGLQIKGGITLKQHLWINGENIKTKKYSDLKSPYDQKVIAEVSMADEDDVRTAINAAEEAFNKMKKLSAHERAEILEKVASYLSEERELCAKMISQESSKPIKASISEVDRTIMTYKFAAQEARNLHGDTIPLDAAPGGENKVAYTVREPIGVIGAITPFNFPMNLVAHKLGPAIAAGNTVVLKPASQTPLSAYKIASIFDKAGLPTGALNVVTGSGKLVGDQFTNDDRVKMITFTGSPKVGISIRENAGLKRSTLELGSNSAVIVDENVEMDKIISRIVFGSFSSQGQVCISVQRIFVHEAIFDKFVEAFVKETKKLRMGDPLDKNTDVSAMITPDDVDRAMGWVNESVKNGAKVACGGEIQGNILKPTVLLNVQLTDKVSSEEVFAPVVHINKVQSFEEAIDQVNQSQYGLQAGVFTNDLNKAFLAAKVIQVGGVLINEIPTFRVDNMPYGGVKMSGMGREGVKFATEEMTELKLVIFNFPHND